MVTHLHRHTNRDHACWTAEWALALCPRQAGSHQRRPLESLAWYVFHTCIPARHWGKDRNHMSSRVSSASKPPTQLGQTRAASPTGAKQHLVAEHAAEVDLQLGARQRPVVLRIQLLEPVQRHDRLLPDLPRQWQTCVRAPCNLRRGGSRKIIGAGHGRLDLCKESLVRPRQRPDCPSASSLGPVRWLSRCFQTMHGGRPCGNATLAWQPLRHTRGCSWSSSLTTGASTATSRSGLISLHVAVSAVHTALTRREGV